MSWNRWRGGWRRGWGWIGEREIASTLLWGAVGGMIAALLGLVAFGAGCSGGAIGSATVLANGARASLDVTAPILKLECVDERERENRECVAAVHAAAGNPVRVAEESAQCDKTRARRDALCSPFGMAYRTVRLSQAALVAAIAAAQGGAEGGEVEVVRRATVLALAVQRLGAVVEQEGARAR